MKVLIISEEIKQKKGGPGSVANHLFHAIQMKGVDIEHLLIYRRKKIKSYFNILKIIFKNNFNIINIHSGNIVPFLLMFSPSNLRKKFVLTQHGYAFAEKSLQGIRKFIYKYGTQFSMKRFQHIIFVSNTLYSKLSPYIDNKNSPIIIHNGFEKISGNFVDKKDQYVFVGSKTWAKGLDQLLETLIKNRVLLTLCIIGGNGPLENKINRLISNYISIGGIVVEYGVRDNYFVQNLLSESKYLIVPSRFDSFNVSVLEAMFNRCIVLALKEVGASEIIKHNYNGFKFDSVNELVNFISKDLKKINVKLEEEIVNNAFSTSNAYTWDRVSDNYLMNFKKIYFKIIQ